MKKSFEQKHPTTVCRPVAEINAEERVIGEKVDAAFIAIYGGKFVDKRYVKPTQGHA
jgi:hypothetical protein